jgi:rod shape-determining protein MreD
VILGLLRGPIGRLLAVGVLLLAVQNTLLIELKPAGVVIQVMLAFSAAAGVVGGADSGVLAGFILGILFDLGVGTPMGLSAIALAFAGLVGALVTLLNIEPQWWVNAIFVALGAGAGELANPLLRSLIGESGILTSHLLVVVPVVSVAAAILSPILVPVARWALCISRTELRLPDAIE